MYAKFARLFAIAAVAFVGVSAAPAADIENIDTRAAEVDGHVYVCTDNNYLGICQNFAFNVGTCIKFNSPFQDSISSVGPDIGFVCLLYVNEGCTGNTITIKWPGLPSLPQGINDELTSFQCFHQ